MRRSGFQRALSHLFSVKKVRGVTYRKTLFVGGLVLLLGAMFLSYRSFFFQHSRLVPSEGGIFTESMIGTMRNINPLASDRTILDQDLGQLIHQGLLRYNPLSGQIEGGLADFHISEDSKTYFITLKNSARFQDGEPVTLEDVFFTFEDVIQNPHFENNVLRDGFEYVSFDVIDEKTLAFNLPEQNVFFPSLLTTPILPKKYFENALIEEITDPDYPANKYPIGAGPYQLKNIVPSDDGSFRVFLTKNKHYYEGVPKIDQMVFYVYPSFDHLRVGHNWTTIFSHVPFAALDQFEQELYGQYFRREYLLPRFTGLFFHLDEAIGTHPALRKALSDSLDKTKILGKEKGWHQIDSFFFFEGIESWHSVNAAQARQRLRQAGLPYNSLLKKRTYGINGDPIVLRMITSTSPPVYSRFAQNIARLWEEELSVEVDLQVLKPLEFQEALETRKYDIVLFGQSFSHNFDVLSTWHSAESGRLNLANLTHKEVDFLIGEVRFSGAQSDLFSLHQKLEDIAPGIVLATPKYNVLVSRDLKGFSETFGKIRSHQHRFFGAWDWYFSEKLAWDWPSESSKLWGFVKWIFGANPL